MRRVRRLPCNRLGKNRKAASPAISMVIITAVTVVLVLVTGNYAYQVLERQRGASEFETVKRSFLAFDDAVRDVAWDRGSSRSARFTVNYGRLELVPNVSLVINVPEYSVSYNLSTERVRYSTSTNYITFGNGYKSYILGDNKTVVSASTEGFGQALIEQTPDWVNILLNYRVRALSTSVVNVTGEGIVNYVDILIIKITATKWSTFIGDFDLIAKNIGITTNSSVIYDVNVNKQCTVSVSLGGSTSSVTIGLVPGKVVFNLVVADVLIST
jgi:hypothetical protein